MPSSFRFLKLAWRESGERRLLPVLRHEMSIKNTRPNTSATKIFGATTVTIMYVINVLSQIVVAESYTLARRTTTPSFPHFLSNLHVYSYRNWTAVACRGQQDPAWSVKQTCNIFGKNNMDLNDCHEKDKELQILKIYINYIKKPLVKDFMWYDTFM